jgi:hypothetical protein
MIDHIEFWVLIYLAIGLAIYYTIPNRKGLPINLSLPYIIFWFVLSIVFLFYQPNPTQKK